MYVGASGAGHVGTESFFDNNMGVAHTHLPGRILELCGIYEFEMAGAIFGLALANAVTPGRPIVI